MKDQRKKLKKNLLYFLFSLIIVFAIISIMMLFFARPYLVKGDSMQPSLNEKNLLIINKGRYRNNPPERFDIIVFKVEHSDGFKQEYIKRIIGLPGETVQILDDKIYINREEISEFYGLENTIEDLGNIGFPIELGQNEYFVLGDNRNESVDSRYTGIGPVKEEQIIGKAVFRLFPFNSIGSLKNQ